ncbi:UBX domain-containing protein 11 isoform X2 [Anguilla anguilla]|uniref:UBX domain-containing protein 11 isoform X2 n=1 Tax=Anguilla anguilla TaxID=7936 RepID=UPI0015AA6559|nr:UBX domain-containing protein 11 isoform X2 [Anguilla anguilla]
MSSPLSILGKNKRVPLPAGQNLGQRCKPFKEKTCAGHEATQMSDIISPGPRQHVALAPDAPSTSRSKVTPRKASGLSDFELMSTMMEKLHLLEKKVCSQSMEIQSKEKKIAVLQEKLRILQKSKVEGGSSGRVEELQQTCHRLQNQVWEMERFLNDYGMVWVGSSVGPQEEAETKEEVLHRPHLPEPDVSVDRDFHMNFDLVLRSVRDLNVLAGEDVSHVQATPGGARLARRSPIPLSLFRNGIIMFDGPFRPYHDPSTQQCMLDLMDGYFPSELQERFPDGVPFQVNDRREEEFKERHVGAKFPGEGKSVGVATEFTIHSNGHTPGQAVHDGHTPKQAVHDGHTPKQAVHDGHTPKQAVHDGHTPKQAVHDGHTPKQAVYDGHTPKQAMYDGHTPKQAVYDQATGGKLSVEQFLNKLPKTVIRAGRVIDIRSSLKADMQSPSCNSTVIETPALQDPRPGTRRSPADDVIVLKVRAEDGRSCYILRMLFSETVGQLRHYLDTHRGPRAYHITSTFPTRRYDDNSQTLRACGLTSNASLLLQPHKDP